MDCKACRREIDLAAGSEELRAAEARAHLESCADCRTFRAERDRLRELLASVGTMQAPPDFDWKLRARLAAEKSAGRRPFFRQGFAPGVPAIAVAATFALLIAAAVYFKQAGTKSLNANPAVAAVNMPAARDVVAVPDVNSVKPDAAVSTAGNRTRGARSIQFKSSKVNGEAARLTLAAARNTASRSNDFSSTAAPVISLFSFPVRTPTQPVKVLLDEGSGTLRTVALQPVTFGSQEILRRGGSVGLAPSPLDRNAEDIW